MITVNSQYSREQLNGMKYDYIKEVRDQRIKLIVSDISNNIINAARIGETKYEYSILKSFYEIMCNNYSFITVNDCKPRIMEYIINDIVQDIEDRLNKMYIDSKIEYIGDQMKFIIDWSMDKIEI
jgi:hypothetical protein